MYVLVIAAKAELSPVIVRLLDHCIVKRQALIAMLRALEDVRSRPQHGALARVGIAEITRLYHDEGWTQQMIGEHFGVTQGAVKNFLKRHGVKARSHSEAARQARRTSPAWLERNRKISEARKREWAALTPEQRREKARPMYAARHVTQ